ncbi:hypothetical protein AKJ16_DCAP06736 [Drosera capensis]
MRRLAAGKGQTKQSPRVKQVGTKGSNVSLPQLPTDSQVFKGKYHLSWASSNSLIVSSISRVFFLFLNSFLLKFMLGSAGRVILLLVWSVNAEVPW